MRSAFACAIVPLALLPLVHVVAREPARLQVAQATHPSDAAWQLVRDTVDPTTIQRFLDQYPDSPHAAEARARLDLLNDRGAPIVIAPAPAAQPSIRDLATELQRELARVGCYSGGIDGRWGPRSRSALARFGGGDRRALGSEPGSEAIAAVNGQAGRACEAAAQPAPAPRSSGTTSSGGRCFDVRVQVDATNAAGAKWDA